MKKIRVGSRDSRLAIIQSERVITAIKKYHPDIETELITMKTTGDRILDKTLDKIGGKGLFVKELDQALYNNEVDITVHSYKDMPLEDNPLLPVVALSVREDPRDVLILPTGINNLDKTALKSLPVGSSSLRRQIQICEIFPGCTATPIRGNVQTRLDKLDRGEFSAILLAAAGIKRLGMEERISRYFTTDEILPAASQGIIAVQGRAGECFEYLKGYHSEESRIISLAERTFVRELNGGCSSPVAAYAVIKGRDIILKGLYFNEPTGEIKRECLTGSMDNAIELGMELADRIREN
jgi:hydroxymethylbilane synthase